MENENQQEQQLNVSVSTNGETTTAHVEPLTVDPPQEPQEPPAPQQQEPPQEPDVQSQVNKAMADEQAIKDDLKTKGIDFDELSEEFDKYGELTKASLEKLEQAGYPKAIIDAYVNGLQATAQQFVNQVVHMAGGEQEFKELQVFLQSQPPHVVQAFNNTIEGGDLNQIKLALDGVKATMRQTFGTANSTLMGSPVGGSSPAGYTNTAEMVKDMSDPRYQKDQAFTQEVYRKISNARFF